MKYKVELLQYDPKEHDTIYQVIHIKTGLIVCQCDDEVCADTICSLLNLHT